MSDFETAHQLEKARVYQATIPPELAFREVIQNRTLPPCSLNEFMDYLYYVEHNAENLQFFLWYCEYVERWSQLLPSQKALSPGWDPDQATEPRSRFVTYSHRRARSDRLNKILSIIDIDPAHEKKYEDDEGISMPMPPTPVFEKGHWRSPSASSMCSLRSPTESLPDWQPFTIPPFRDEFSKVVRHYITEGSPRQLNLTAKDRQFCLKASQHTTHPSALLPAFVVADAHLRGHSHPNFIRWSVANVNTPRLVLLTIIGVIIFLLGLVLNIVLILSSLSPYLRIVCIILWWPALTVLLAAWKGLCLALHLHNLRHARPWEQLAGPIEDVTDAKLDDADSFTQAFRKHGRKDTNSSQVSAVDPLRKATLQTLGPKNDHSKEAWIAVYKGKSLLRKIMEPKLAVQNGELQLLQDRAVFYAVVWAGLGTSVLTLLSLFIPGRHLF